ncbi:MAG: four helix bundle protein [Balneola sp.]
MNNKGPVYKKSFEFSLLIITLYKAMIAKNEYVISKQILRSGTSIGANVNEASAAESKKDFLHKMAISSKEARETLYWLHLLEESELIDIKLYNEIQKCKELIRILTSIVKTTKLKLNT